MGFPCAVSTRNPTPLTRVRGVPRFVSFTRCEEAGCPFPEDGRREQAPLTHARRDEGGCGVQRRAGSLSSSARVCPPPLHEPLLLASVVVPRLLSGSTCPTDDAPPSRRGWQ